MFAETNFHDFENDRNQNALYRLRREEKAQNVDDERIEQLLSSINKLVDSLPFSRRTREVKNKPRVWRPFWWHLEAKDQNRILGAMADDTTLQDRKGETEKKINVLEKKLRRMQDLFFYHYLVI